MGDLPNGLSLSPEGVLSGTPTVNGDFTFNISAVDISGCSKVVGYKLTINCPKITIYPATLPVGAIGTQYNASFKQKGGIGTAIFSLSDGELPRGLSLSSSGLLSGIPQMKGKFKFRIKAFDGFGCSGTRSYLLVVN